MRHDNHAASGGHFSLTFFAGMAIGVALGMLFAPSDGRRLRTQLSDGAQRFGRRTAETYNEAAHRMSELLERGRSATSAGREAFQRARERATSEMGADV